MRISRIRQIDGDDIQLVTTLKPLHRLGMIVVGVACMGIVFDTDFISPGGYKYFALMAIGILALAIGMGRFMYVIRNDKSVLFRLELLGFPILSHVGSSKYFHSMEIEEENDGTFSLRFRDAANHLRFTLDDFPTRDLAERVGGLFRIDEEKQSIAVNLFVEEAVREKRSVSRGVAGCLITVVFLFIPWSTFITETTLDQVISQALTGIVLVILAFYAVQNDSGIIKVADDNSYIDRWVRQRWFRIVEYREYLGTNAQQAYLRVRISKSIWLILFLALFQASSVYAICYYNTLEAKAEAKAEAEAQAKEFSERKKREALYDSEAAREGIKRFQEIIEKRERGE